MLYVGLAKIVFFILLNNFCQLKIGFMVWMVLGTIIEAVITGSFRLHNWDNYIFKEILYYPALLMQLIPLTIVTVQYMGLPNSELNFVMATALGSLGVWIAACWFGTGFEGPLGPIVGFTGSFYALILNGILRLICKMDYHTLLIINIAICAIAVLVIIIARFAKGSNLE